MPTFENRKQDHIEHSLGEACQATGLSDLDRIQLVHHSLPDLNFEDIQINTTVLNLEQKTPFYVASMTGGFPGSVDINLKIAKVCAQRGWLMGVGSQRKELTNPEAKVEWENLVQQVPHVNLLSNIGISQLITSTPDQILQLVENLSAKALIVHLNPLQEALQMEGTPQFKGGIGALRVIKKHLTVPLIIKETGSGISKPVLELLNSLEVDAVDVSGLGGTHWGRIEGARANSGSFSQIAAETFADWGESTLSSVMIASAMKPKYEVWGSGGVRSGLDAAKLLSLGADLVGFARPILVAALQSEQQLDKTMEQFELELKIAMFCTNCGTIDDLRTKKVWAWKKSY
ncbi:MAG: type 2 isopentenyl-diphosphate Delta-isomerase [Bdellovibrionaceae bacterium]|jgi:isopentenyl-diphosphate Delta-isomerase|nr:type 2 isopentenyl-diphosphate Delta-isomerase [Pseudobdellovibrionaceae bacterium]